MKKYTVIWDGGFKQANLSKSQAIKIAADLLNDYDSVEIILQK